MGTPKCRERCLAGLRLKAAHGARTGTTPVRGLKQRGFSVAGVVQPPRPHVEPLASFTKHEFEERSQNSSPNGRGRQKTKMDSGAGEVVAQGAVPFMAPLHRQVYRWWSTACFVGSLNNWFACGGGRAFDLLQIRGSVSKP